MRRLPSSASSSDSAISERWPVSSACLTIGGQKRMEPRERVLPRGSPFFNARKCFAGRHAQKPRRKAGQHQAKHQRSERSSCESMRCDATSFFSQAARVNAKTMVNKRTGKDRLAQLGLLALQAPQVERSFVSSMENVARAARLRARLTNVSSIRLP